jgi:CRP-like cAMP-binding protein
MPKTMKTVSCDKCTCIGKSIFCNLESSVLENISSNKVMNHYRKGQTLYFQGNPSFGLYCINSGKIKISKIGTDGKEIIIRIAGPGDVLGHQNLYSIDNYTATATVIEEASICFLDKRFILNQIGTEPVIAMNIIKKLSEEMAAFEARSAAMSHKSVRERLAELLLLLKNTYGITEHGRLKLDIKLTREEMASMVGTANETIIRFISEFKEEGILEQEGKVIYIMNEDKLKKTANLIA